ncbi:MULTISPECIES: glycosyltransferase [unclassified Crossiella]|uniref:glycosyltransferase n=1 Tax=unclassified Crossiella TaxID=2620835 RepID=UPI001FFF873C|nr:MULTISPECIES: glycosyltransferase [unclassified Crossiella]MCK2239896.1 glycosyltransferase [Crossiella sp. S99.2]MCK2252604.1 glycosyltransferase [Crossiella sp. S99.1]
MRILFSSSAGHGHLLPLFPLARAAARAGHAVAVQVAEQARHLVEGQGLELLAVGPSQAELLTAVHQRTGVDLTRGFTPEAELDFFVGARLDLAAESAVAQARDWKPDLVVHEMADFLGPFVAAALDVPAAMFSYGTRRPDERTEVLHQGADPHYARHALTRTPPIYYLDTCPPTLNYPDWQPPAPRLLLRPEPHTQPSATFDPLPAKGSRPRVLVTFGTAFGSPQVVNPLLREIATLDVDILVTQGLSTDAGFEAPTANVHFVPFTPLSALLADADAVVTHGGAGTTLATLALGLPLVVVPQGADQFRQAERVTAVGAGLAVHQPGEVAAAVRLCLADSGIRAAAARLGREIAAMPPAAEVVEVLTATAAR